MSSAAYTFACDSMLWKICRERVTLLHGPAAAVLQVAHPRIALGVREHSNFQISPIARLDRTLDAVFTMAFGTRAEGEAAANRVARIHDQVTGDAAAHDVPGSAVYCAREPDLLLWVIATMIVAAVDGYEHFVGPLSLMEKESFYRDMRRLAVFFDLAPEYGPQTWPEFEHYYREQIDSSLLGGHAITRQVAWSVAMPRRPRWLWVSSHLIHFIFSEILPQPLRSRLGFHSTRFSRAMLWLTTHSLRLFVLIAPARLRFVPHYRRATGKLRLDILRRLGLFLQRRLHRPPNVPFGVGIGNDVAAFVDKNVSGELVDAVSRERRAG